MRGFCAAPFVCTEALEDLSGIAPRSTTKVIEQRGVSLVSLENSALYKQPHRWNNRDPYILAPLIWTLIPVVTMPAIAHPPVNPPKKPPIHDIIIEKEEMFLQYLGISFKPEISTVMENLRNVSKSRFFSERHSQNCIGGGGKVLVDVVYNILVYLKIQQIDVNLLRDSYSLYPSEC